MPSIVLDMKLAPGASIPEERPPLKVEITFERSESAAESGRESATTVRDQFRVELLSLPMSVALPGAIAATGIDVAFLAVDGTAALNKRLPGQDKGPFSLTLSSEDVSRIYAKSQKIPKLPPISSVTRRVKFIQTSPTVPPYSASRVEYAVASSTTGWADLALEELFRSNVPLSASIEWAGDGWKGLTRANWQSARLSVDGSFDVVVPANGDCILLWWLQGPRAALGAVTPDLMRPSKENSVIPAVLPAFASPTEPAKPLTGGTSPYNAQGGCARSERLPMGTTEAELADNPQVYTEDAGEFCKPFCNPERVMSERSFYTIIRVDQPEVSARPSGGKNKQYVVDLDDLLHLTGSKKESAKRLAVGKSMKNEKTSVEYERHVNSLSAGRSDLDAKHPVQWESDIARYQASSVARGHLLEYRVCWRANGYSLGTVAKTLTLAPRQVKRIQKVEWERRESTRRAEATQQKDSVEDAVIRERDYDDTLRASLHEWSFGASAAAAGGAAGAIGFFAEAVLGGVGAAAGGAGSAAYQEAGRATTAREEQRLRDSIHRYADALRRFESVVVNELTQEETVTGTTEVLRNFNYAHSLTIIYYQILRHLRVETEFAGVAECLFVPFAIKPFTLERVYRWREAIVRYLRAPKYRRGLQHVRDVLTDFEYSDIPEGRRADQRITSLRGSIYLKLAVERPADTDSLTFNKSTWQDIAPLLPEPAHAIYGALTNVATADRDRFYQRNFAGGIATRWCNELRLTFEEGQFDADFTLASRYGFGESVRVDFTVNTATLPGLTRAALNGLVVKAGKALPPGSYANVTSATLTYTTDNFEYQIRDSGGTRDLIQPETGHRDPGGAMLSLPLTRWERVDQRAEIQQAVAELVEHLNEHIEYYHKAIWWSMDRDRLFMLIDGFYAPGTNLISIASIVEREPMGIIGNSLVFKVSPGAFIGLGEIDTPAKLYNLYADNQKPRDPMHVSLPTDGLYAQSVLDPCPALEEHFGNHDWVLGQPDIDPGTLAPELLTSRRTEPSDAAKPTEMGPTLINLQNAPEAPPPSGLQGILNTVGKGDSFRDLTGLAGNQANAQAALQAASGLATSFGNSAVNLAAAQLAAKVHATNTADQKLASIKRAQNQGLIEQPEAARQAADVLRDMHNPKTLTRPHQEAPIIEAIQAATHNRGSVVEATTSEGQVKVTIGNAGVGGGAGMTIGGGEAETKNGNPSTEALAAITQIFPALDFSITEPLARNCCALFPGGVTVPVPPFAVVASETQYLSISDIPGHRYGASGLNPVDPVGQVYTAKGGFVDLGHVRDLADTTRFLAVHALQRQLQGGEITLGDEGGRRVIVFKQASGIFPNVELACLLAARIAYEFAIWHEIVTWYSRTQRHSSFSPEDNFSNLLGTLIGAAACLTRNKTYNESMDEIIIQTLESLQAKPGDEARNAVEQVRGLWYRTNDSLNNALSRHLLLRRHIVPAPAVTPWLITDLHGRTFRPDGSGPERTISFDLGSPNPVPTTLNVPTTTSNGLQLTDFYDIRIDVNTDEVPSGTLPSGRRSVFGSDLMDIVQKVRNEVIEIFPTGDQAIDR